MSKKKSSKNGRRKMGRPNTRGETVPVAFRMSKELSRKIDVLRRRAKQGLSRTAALERLIRSGLEKEKDQWDRVRQDD